MSLVFYLDHHVPAAIAYGLRQLQVDVLTVAEDGAAQRPSGGRELGEERGPIWGLRIPQIGSFSAVSPVELAELQKLPGMEIAWICGFPVAAGQTAGFLR